MTVSQHDHQGGQQTEQEQELTGGQAPPLGQGGQVLLLPLLHYYLVLYSVQHKVWERISVWNSLVGQGKAGGRWSEEWEWEADGNFR